VIGNEPGYAANQIVNNAASGISIGNDTGVCSTSVTFSVVPFTDNISGNAAYGIDVNNRQNGANCNLSLSNLTQVQFSNNANGNYNFTCGSGGITCS
jgi:hypothetical protein